MAGNAAQALLYSVVLLQLSLLTTAALSKKKGLGVSQKNYKCGDLDQFKNMQWWYDWGDSDTYHSDKYACTNALMGNRIPMKWGWRKKATKPQFSFTGSSEIILGFNEPNHAKQANMTPTEAASYWKELENATKAYGAKYLVSPAAAPGGFYNWFDWFDEFFALCKDCQIDYIATHIYSCKAIQVMRKLQRISTRYPNKKIWLTEFACPLSYNATQQLEFMKDVLPLLEEADYVDRYAWFVSRRTANTTDDYVKASVSLLEQGESKLTELGQYYDDYNPV